MTTQKKNYQKELDLILEKIKFQEEEEPEHKKPTLLLLCIHFLGLQQMVLHQ